MKNFTNNFKQFTSRLSARWLIMALMMLVVTSSAWAAQYNLNWQGKVYFLVPETWDISTYSYVQVDITRTTSANSSNYQFYAGRMTRIGTSRLFYLQLNANHSNWNQDEYIAFTANSSTYDSGSFNLNGNKLYTTPLDYGCNNSNNYYLFKPLTESQFTTTTNGNTLKANYNSSKDNVLKADQTVNIYTNGSSSADGGSVSLKGYYFTSDTEITSSTANSSGASGKYGAVIGSEMTLTASANTGYEFDGWYNAASDGTLLSSSATYTYNVYEAKTIYARFTQSCSPSATLSSAVYDAVNNEIDLSGSIAPCGKELFYGFLWKNKNDANWNTENAISGTGGNNNKTTEDIDFNQSWDDFTPGDTYEFTAYALDATTNPYTWYYSTDENNVIEVSTCTSIPDNTYAIAGNNEWTGNANPVTINYDANTYGTPTILYDGEAQIPTDVGTYAITINVPAHNGYCASTISLGDYEITCIDVEKPAITTSATVCEGTQVTLSNYNGVNDNTVKWYSDEECNSEVTAQVTLTDNDTKYYAKAYHAASGCYSSEYSTLTFTVNPLPAISISGNNSAVLYEDVELTAATDGTSISWEITEGDGSLSSTTGNSVTLTSSSADNVTVTATATLGSCTATDTHEVEFSAENCADVASNDIQITFIHPNNKSKACQYWGLGKLTYYIGSTKYVHDFGTSTTAGAEGNLTIPDLTVDKITGVRLDAAYDYSQCTAYATITDLPKGYHYTLTLSDAQQESGNQQKSVTRSSISLTEAPPITAPAAKTISVSTTDGEGNIIFSGQVVKTGCDATNEYGFQYSSDEQTWTTVKVGVNAVAGTAISNNTVKGLDGIYYVRAYITNDNSTQYGAVKAITVSTEKDPITSVVLTHVRNQAGESYSDQELANLIYCVGDIVWFKLEQDGSNFQEYEWISYPGTELEGMYPGGMFKLKITESGNVGIRLRNEENVDGEGNPTWVESNLLEFNTHPEPTAPTISFATATICSNDNVGATLTLGATVSGQEYELWKYTNDDDTEGSKVANVATLNCTENNQALQFTGIKTAGKYFVKTYYTAFCNTVIANSTHATLTVVNANDVYISISPATAETTPWMPVKLTVAASDDYTLEVPEGVEFDQNGNICSVKIPLPQGATGGEGQYDNVSFPQDATTSYIVTAKLVGTGGEDNPCAVPATATVTLTPYVEECTIGH